MIVYAAADLHGNLPPVPEDAELILLAGDICPDFRPYGNRGGLVDTGGIQQHRWMMKEFLTWAADIAERGIELAYIWGNHDFVGEQPWHVREITNHVKGTFLQDNERGVGGVNIWGTPWVPGLPYWAFYGDDRKLALRAEAIPDGLDVLMTHGPPAYAGDYIPTSEKQRNKYGNFGGAHVGDPTLNERILAMSAPPKVVICGHIHEDRGAHEVAGVPVYNVAAVDAQYRLHEHPWTRLYELG